MKRFIVTGFLIVFSLFSVFAQSDDDLFGGDDDFFFGDGIEEFEPAPVQDAATVDLSKGVLFQAGAVKVGGNFTTSIGTSTTVYSHNDKTFKDNLSDSELTPTLSANLSVDARPSETLRMYAKFGMAYPFASNVTSSLKTQNINLAEIDLSQIDLSGLDLSIDLSEIDLTQYGLPDIKLPNIDLSKIDLSKIELPDTVIPVVTGVDVNVQDWIRLKELFTDFSIADTVFFRFGLHTVTWGTGFFFSPVSDIINTSSIDPEDTSAQVDGCLNLRTQVILPNTQNCLWFYVIPDTDFSSSFSPVTYTKKTGFAGKADLVTGGWEFGVGGFWKWESAPKVMFTASGSIKNLNLFGETVYVYGSNNEWSMSTDWDNKSKFFQSTVGGSYYWKNPGITLAGQYYFDGNNDDLIHKYFTYGHNFAALASFGKLFGSKDLTVAVFGLVNFGKEEISSEYNSILEVLGLSSLFNTATFSALLNYTPTKEITVTAGPYITVSNWKESPTVAVKLNVSLGGGKF